MRSIHFYPNSPSRVKNMERHYKTAIRHQDSKFSGGITKAINHSIACSYTFIGAKRTRSFAKDTGQQQILDSGLFIRKLDLSPMPFRMLSKLFFGREIDRH